MEELEGKASQVSKRQMPRSIALSLSPGDTVKKVTTLIRLALQFRSQSAGPRMVFRSDVEYNTYSTKSGELKPSNG